MFVDDVLNKDWRATFRNKEVYVPDRTGFFNILKFGTSMLLGILGKNKYKNGELVYIY